MKPRQSMSVSGSYEPGRSTSFAQADTSGGLMGGSVNTKQAKDFLVQQVVEQAALECVPLTDIEKRMMYFTNDELEGWYETWEYEARISRLLHHSYKRLRDEDTEGATNWRQAIGALRGDDHYLLVLWHIKPPSEHPILHFLKLFGVGAVIAMGIGIAALLAAKFDIGPDRYRKYLTIAIIGLVLLTAGAVRLLYRLVLTWFHREAKQHKVSN